MQGKGEEGSKGRSGVPLQLGAFEQRPGGNEEGNHMTLGRALGVFREEQEGHCDWRGVSTGRAGGDESRAWQRWARIVPAFSRGKD